MKWATAVLCVLTAILFLVGGNFDNGVIWLMLAILFARLELIESDHE